MFRGRPAVSRFSDCDGFDWFVAATGNRMKKRARDAMAPPPASKEEYVNLFTLQPQQSASSFANVALFQNLENRVSSSPSPALVSTGLRLAFDEQQQLQQQQQQESSKHMNNNALRYSSLFASVSDELAAQVKQNDEEMDRFIREQVNCLSVVSSSSSTSILQSSLTPEMSRASS